MPFILRRTTLPTTQEITAVPQIVIVDQTGPAIFVGEGDGIAVLVGEFVKGPFQTIEPGSPGTLAALYGERVYPYFSQSGLSGTPVQDGTGGAYNGNGMLQLLGLAFKRLGISRVDTEAVTTDGGTTKAALSITVTVAAADQDGSSNTNKDILLKAGTRFGSANTFGGSTRVFGLSGDVLIPKGTALTTNAVTVTAPCFPIRVVEPVVATGVAAIVFVLDPAIENVTAATTITTVNNTTALWPAGTGVTLALRVESRYQGAIDRTLPGNDDVTPDVNVVWSARRSQGIRQALNLNAAAAAEGGRGRMTLVSADPATAADATSALTAKTAALALVGSDGYAQPADRVTVAFPHHKVVVPDFGSVKAVRSSDCLMACLLSNLPNENNPGEQNTLLQGGAVVELEDAFINNPLSKQDIINLLAAGVCPLRKDRSAGWWFEDGRTAAPRATQPTRYTIKRRRMADEIQDSIAIIAAGYVKRPATTDRVEAFTSEVNSYLTNLASPTVPAAQRIVGFTLDEKSGNTPDLQAAGIFSLIIKVRILSTMDEIVLRTEIGESVNLPAAA